MAFVVRPDGWLQELALRTIGIFKYPRGADVAHVLEHAEAFGCRFGKVAKTSFKRDAAGRPYAVLNFEAASAASAALADSSELDFQTCPVYPKPWYLPDQRPTSGADVHAITALQQSSGYFRLRSAIAWG